MDHTIKMFLKFGSEKNIRDLYENGTIFINTIERHRRTEDEELRGDKYEGASRIINSLPGTFKIPGIKQEFRYEKIHVKESYEKVLGNIYSLYCISSHGFPNPLDFKIDEQNTRFGSHCLMIKNNAHFLNLIQAGLTKKGYRFQHGFVKYYDKNSINKELTVFEKPMEFEYQKEFRFYVENNELKPIIVQIGSLKDYSDILTMEEIMNLKVEVT